MEIEELCTFSEAKRQDTKNGPRNLRKAIIKKSSQFWQAWNTNKQLLKDAGIQIKPINESWENTEVFWWTPITEAQTVEIKQAIESSKAKDADFFVPAPEGCVFLPFQLAGIKYASERTNCLIGDSMGLGKSIQAVGVYTVTNSSKCIVVCPSSLRLNWKREFLKWSFRPVKVAVILNGKDFPQEDFDVLIVNYDVVSKHRKNIDNFVWDLAIYDEAHYLKNPKTSRTVAVLGDKKEIKPIQSKRKLFLTGTPIVNRPKELFPMLESLDPQGLGRNFVSFGYKYCGAKTNRWGTDFNGASNLEELQRLMREKFMVRRLKEEVLTELPPKRRQVIEIPANGAISLVRQELAEQDKIDTFLAEIELAKTISKEVYDQKVLLLKKEIHLALGEIAKARAELAKIKCEKVITHLEDSLENGPVVCFAHHKEVIEKIAEHFGDKAVTLTGSTKLEDRQLAVDRFQKGEVDLFIGNIQAAGVGITLIRSSHVVFAELDWVPGNMSQAEDRCARYGQKNSVLVQHVVLEGSLDAIISKKLIEKQAVIDQALDNTVTIPEWGTPILNVDITFPEKIVLPELVTFEELKENKMSIEERNSILTQLKKLASICDGAISDDSKGFNAVDSKIGKNLANKKELSDKESTLGMKILAKYKRQLEKL